jgi:hypothetical protein
MPHRRRPPEYPPPPLYRRQKPEAAGRLQPPLSRSNPPTEVREVFQHDDGTAPGLDSWVTTDGSHTDGCHRQVFQELPSPCPSLRVLSCTRNYSAEDVRLVRSTDQALAQALPTRLCRGIGLQPNDCSDRRKTQTFVGARCALALFLPKPHALRLASYSHARLNPWRVARRLCGDRPGQGDKGGWWC